MRVVIDIPENIYDTIMADEMISREQLAVLQKHIYYGTPLPKGHGRLIDADAEIKKIQGISDRVKNRNAPCLDVYDGEIAAMKLAPTIIEADTESEDKLDGDPIDIDKAVEHYEKTLETLKGIDLEVDV